MSHKLIFIPLLHQEYDDIDYIYFNIYVTYRQAIGLDKI